MSELNKTNWNNYYKMNNFNFTKFQKVLNFHFLRKLMKRASLLSKTKKHRWTDYFI